MCSQPFQTDARTLTELAQRLLQRRYPDTSQECPF